MYLASPPKLPLDFVRSQFPALDSYCTFLDNAGGTQLLLSVIQRINDYWLTSNVQLGGAYTPSLQASDRLNTALEDLTDFMQADQSCELILGSSASLLLRILALSLGQTWRAGDEVIVTNVDHEANISPWLDLRERGIIIKTWPLNPDTLQLELRDLEPLLSDRTRLVAVTHASNILGTIVPIAEIAALVHGVGAYVCVDGVGYAPHRLLQCQDWDVDFYVFSLYKVFGPRQAALYGKQAILEALPRFNHEFITTLPHKFQPGGGSYAEIYGIQGIFDYFQNLGSQLGGVGTDLRELLDRCFKTIAAHEAALVDQLLDGLRGHFSGRILGIADGDPDRRVATLSLALDGLDPQMISDRLAENHMGIRHGHFYAQRLLSALGYDPHVGVLRISPVHYNTAEEIDRLLQALIPLLHG